MESEGFDAKSYYILVIDNDPPSEGLNAWETQQPREKGRLG